ncbi:MAG: DUF4174 domain-containing protein [Granulosicoccus sp.]|nr:DUF4174 domain-containing protein [Granulosicoccus sp.]
MNSHANYSDRRQVIVFATPDSDIAKGMQRTIDSMSCQLVDRDTDVRIVDVTELPDRSLGSTDEQHSGELLNTLARLRSDTLPDFELVLVGKDGTVKARSTDPSALADFLDLIDTMPMRRAEVLSRDADVSACDRK